MGLASSKERPPLNCLMTGTVGAEPLRLLLESAGLSRVTVTQPASQSTACQSDGSAFGASVGSSMMVLPTDDAELYLLNVERHGIRIDGYSLLAPAPPDSATLEGFLDRQALLFIVDAAPNATPAATLATEKERLHDLLGSMSGRPPLAVVIALNSKQGCHPLPGADGGSLSDGVRQRLGLDELKAGGALVQLLEMSSEDFPDATCMAEALEWIAQQLGE